MDHANYLTVREFSKRARCSQITVRRLIANGKLPVFQPGGSGCKILIPIESLSAVRRSPAADSEPIPRSILPKVQEAKPVQPVRRPSWQKNQTK